MEDIKDLINKAIQKRKRANLDMFKYLVAQTVNFDEVKIVTECLMKHGLTPVKKVFALLMQLVENYDDARNILIDMKKIGLTPDSKTYMELIDTSKDNLQARQIINEMNEEKIKINPVIYNILLSKQNSYIKAREVLEEMKSMIFEPTHITYHSLLSKANNDEDVKDVIDEMNSLNIQIDIDLYNDLKNFDRQTRADKIRAAMILFNPRGSDRLNGIIQRNTIPKKKQRNIQVIERDCVLVNYLKNIYDNQCQICGVRLNLGNDKFYSEVHHIQPLSCEGPDILENMIVICSNHHKLFDRGSLTIDIKNNKVIHKDSNDSINGVELKSKHLINKKYLDYHNDFIFQ